MPSTAALRLEIEDALKHRFPAALTPAPRTIREVAATGIATVDELLCGGLPVGAISELSGAASSGRTSLALKFVAQRTAEARACAWVDVNDTLDPPSAAANGVRLRQLLWMRCRDEAAGKTTRWASKRWARLDQALRATDLLLQAGGFAAIVLDLGDTAPEQASRIPLATWFRFRQAAERTQCSLLVLGKRAYAQSAAAVVLECMAVSAEVAGGTVLRGLRFEVRRNRERFAPVDIGTRKPGSTTTGLSGWDRKPPAATWQANAAWDAVAAAERRA